MQDDVIRSEDENNERTEFQEQADEKQREADALRQKAIKRKK